MKIKIVNGDNLKETDIVYAVKNNFLQITKEVKIQMVSIKNNFKLDYNKKKLHNSSLDQPLDSRFDQPFEKKGEFIGNRLYFKSNCTYKGSINEENKVPISILYLSSESLWTLTGNCYLSAIWDEDSTLLNINDKGYTIYYDDKNPLNNWVKGKQIMLKDGGWLKPMSVGMDKRQ